MRSINKKHNYIYIKLELLILHKDNKIVADNLYKHSLLDGDNNARVLLEIDHSYCTKQTLHQTNNA